MVDANGVSLRYTTRQRSCESGLSRYKVLSKEKKAKGVEELETELSRHSHRAVNVVDFLSYLVQQRESLMTRQ
jgi:hypothetical protein